MSPSENTTSSGFQIQKKPPATQAVAQSVAPIRAGSHHDSDVYNRIDNSLVVGYLGTDSYMAKVSGAGMTNHKALQVKIIGMQLRCSILIYDEGVVSDRKEACRL